MRPGASLRRRLELSVASGMTLALAWELWEYYAFVTNSSESATAYGDTVLDLALGWAGAVVAALLVGAFHPVDPGGVRALSTEGPASDDG